ncbi:hypothetical protein CsatB_014995 [Cannabis sativa]
MSLFGSLSFGCLGSGNGKEQEETNELESLFKKINDWELPRVPINQIYKQRYAFFKTSSTHDHTIGTIEQTITLTKEQETIQLLSNKVLSKSRLESIRRSFSYFHMGLVQVAIKPLSQESLTTSVLMSLRDCRLLNFEQSMLTAVETNLCNGPVYFDYYPNYSVSLQDPLFEILTLDIKIGSLPAALIYRVHYRVMKSIVFSDIGLKTSKEQVQVMHVDLTKSSKPKPRIIRLDEVNLPESWKVRDQERSAVAENEENSEIHID